jgi:hypothetical protein
VFAPLVAAQDLDLTITLSDVDISAFADEGEFSAARLTVQGSFGSGSTPGEGIIETWGFDKEILANNDPFVQASILLFDGMNSLEADTNYWISTEITTAAIAVPEPLPGWLLATGLAALAWRVRRG